MQEITIEAVKDFQMCSLLHDYRHRQNLLEPIAGNSLVPDRYDEVMRQIVSFFFTKVQGGWIPSYNVLVKKWEKLWFPKDMTAYDLSVAQITPIQAGFLNASNTAAMALLKFRNDFSEDLGMPLLINEDFVVPIYQEYCLKGSFDFVLKLKNKVTIYKISTSFVRPQLSRLRMDFAALRYSFGYRSAGKDLEIDFKLYDLGSHNPGIVDIDVSPEDVRALMFWAKESLTTKFFVPRRGLTAACKGCPFDKECSEFEITEEMLTQV